MNKIIFPLKPGTQGPSVGDLQTVLLLLLDRAMILSNDEGARRELSTILKRELADQIYKDVTAKVVSIFQEEHQLTVETRGMVDETTANAINAILSELGLLDDGGWAKLAEILNTQGQTLSTIRLGTDHLASIDEKIGTLGKLPSLPLSLNARGAAVKDLQTQLMRLGVVLPAIETTEAIFGVGTRDALLQLQAKNGLSLTGIFDNETRNALDKAVGNVENPRRVEGRIFLDNGLPAAKINVRIVNKGFGEEAVVLGDTQTNDLGFYALQYDQNIGTANIEVYTFDQNNKQIRLSNPKLNADRSEVINLDAPSTVQSKANEFTLMAGDLKPIVGNDLSNLAKAKEDNDRQDLSLLYKPTGWDARLIATAAIAAKVNTKTGIGLEALYGAFRAGLPTDSEALAQVTTEAFALGLTRAKDAGIIALDDQKMKAAESAFATFSEETRRKMIVPGALSSLSEMLERAPIDDPTHRDVFEKLLLSHDGDEAELWNGAKEKGIPQKQIAKLQLQGKLSFLTLNNAPLTESLQQDIVSQDNLAELVEKDFYQQETWVNRLKGLASDDHGVVNEDKLASLIPSTYIQKDLNDRLAAYADDLAQKVRKSFPTHVVNRMLGKNDLKLGEQHDQMKAPVHTFLKNAVNIGFHLGRTPVEQFFKKHGEIVFNGFNDDNKKLAKEGVKLLTRTYQMTPNDESMKTLLELGFTSAREVTAIPKNEFVARYWEKFGSRKITGAVWDKSVQITSVTFNIFTMAKQLDSTPPVMAISGKHDRHNQAKEDLKSLLKDYPTMNSLFGSLDFCECEHCRSVLSPAAYLVDLLRFLDLPSKDWDQTMKDWKEKHNNREYTGPDYNYLKPYNALIQRRPDLPYLPLTCENTNKAMPYIDLVNEILEYYVANNHLDANAVRDTGDAESAELLSEPQNIVPEAYDKLENARYPLTLPFNLWLESVRSFCEYFETPLWMVLDSFRPSESLFAPESNPETYYRAQIFAEYLGLSSKEYEIYTDSAFSTWPVLYGYDNPSGTADTTLAALKSAKTLSKRLGVTYKELTALIQTLFVNPNLSSLVTLHKLGIEVTDVFRYKKHDGYTTFSSEEEAEFEYRLTQLSEKFGHDAKQWLNITWDEHKFEKIVTLRGSDDTCNFDNILVTFADGNTTDALTFIKLNLFVRLWKRLGWSIEETDHALQTFIPSKLDMSEATLGNAMKTALIYLAHLKELTELTGIGSRLKLLTLWATLPTHGKNSLYEQLFLTRNILKADPTFDDMLGDYLSKPNVFIKDHLPALQAALNLTATEIAQILQDGIAGEEHAINNAILSLNNVSMLYRYALLSKILNLSIGELITLKVLSGLNPFHPLSPDPLNGIEDDYPLTQTLEFVRCAQQVKVSSFSVDDLDYLFRDHFDPLGKYREDSGFNLAWIRTLATQLRTIANEYAVPDKADSVSDDTLRQKMTLVFAPDVVEMLLDKVPFTKTKESVLPQNRLDPKVYEVNGFSVTYDEIRQQQKVTHLGVLTASAKTALLNQIPSSSDPDAINARKIFSDLLDQIETQSTAQYKALFDKQLAGILTFDEFFGTAVTTIQVEKRMILLKKIVPLIKAKIARQTIMQELTIQTGSDAALIEALLTNKDFLAITDADSQPLVAQFQGLEQGGISMELTPTDPHAQTIKKTVEKVEITASDKCRQAAWRGFIEVPENGAYRFYAKLGKKDAEVYLHLDSVVEPILSGSAMKDDDELSGSIDLKSGVLYTFTLEAGKLQDSPFELLVKGEITPKDNLSQFIAIPKAEVEGATRAFKMLAKSLQIAQGLGFNEREVRHILSHPSDFGNVNWRLLPTKEPGNKPEDAVALFNGFMRLLHYSLLKRDMAGGGDGLISIFEHARQKNLADVKTLYEQIAKLTRRKSDVVEDVAAELKMTVPEQVAVEANMERLWQALKIVEKFGVSMASLKKWLTPQPNPDVSKEVRNSIKSRYEPEVWQRIAKSIFDPLRQRKRDALVAHIIHINEKLDSIEKLFEYFLIDPGTEPVVQTSRLRLAISSLQTFIQRCFLNLEEQVHPSVLNAKHWGWMKRYRVWEANRKIFLFPENWLEPEWRDDKTHLYQELESSLLQGDVTNQLAEDALYVYLKKLDQLARLEMVTMYAEENPFGPPTIHVIGRTYSKPHQYFYRRYAYQMWTPWEPVTAEIDSDHIVTVIWRERLHLFWLTFMEKVDENPNGPTTGQTGNLGDIRFDTLVCEAGQISKGVAQRKLDIQLNWSEYFQGSWTPRESSGIGNVIDLSGPFNPGEISVRVSKEEDSTTDAVLINLMGVPAYFRVVSKNSRPQFGKGNMNDQAFPYSHSNETYNLYEGNGTLSVTFVKRIVTIDGDRKENPPDPQNILSNVGNYTLLPTSNKMRLLSEEFAPLISPIFYADDMYTFFVEPSLTEKTIDTWEGYAITPPSQKSRWVDYVMRPPNISPLIASKYLQEALNGNISKPDPIDPVALHSIKVNVDALTQPGVALQFGDTLVGRTGRMDHPGNNARVIRSVGGNMTIRGARTL
ncbi:Putative peptidoglycan binding domain-containing protein [Bacillus sp. OV166]|uniref:neuraminidase-like domain-containing protein n=1 Tax=Bacillus sp. OV166 TaxID=1882763 RepID=UPI000A2AAD29|nr:neuraminidase-like domain-containing protein [Bacillus sp. OV166]SMQ78430.1 Putative peptidoglycan binding domain-containing protein [Bacillus sp. OV166]